MWGRLTEGAVAFCTECGTAHETGQSFCANCGAQLGGVLTATKPTWEPIAPRAPITGMSILSFVLGLFSTFGAPGVFAFVVLGFLGPFVLGLLAVIAGMFAHESAHKHGWRGDLLATTGITLGVLGSLTGVLLLVTFRI